MKKLNLSLDALHVESFEPLASVEDAGTVIAHGSGPYTDECDSCGVATGCDPGGCPGTGTDPSRACPTDTCYEYHTCAGAYTCGGVPTCVYPECTRVGAIC